ncbi:hypothetical protein COV25_04200 [candidate division WWE3 bacterium CG10_big_fil_rev_8_21_14_0_10_35_32]|nr:MAG: hypothetical protein COV25_04200 [candidate division WWE3 bacterium CG10_big_fil_rev_8_21_14_0_10_35_32]
MDKFKKYCLLSIFIPTIGMSLIFITITKSFAEYGSWQMEAAQGTKYDIMADYPDDSGSPWIVLVGVIGLGIYVSFQNYKKDQSTKIAELERKIDKHNKAIHENGSSV